ncbi:MAG: septum formation initiator family protein [Myxococcota bacterium]
MSKRFVVLAAACFALGIVTVMHTLFYSGNWQNRQRLRADLATLQAENTAAQERVSWLRNQITALRERPEVQERIVRHELGYVHPDEIVMELGNIP